MTKEDYRKRKDEYRGKILVFFFDVDELYGAEELDLYNLRGLEEKCKYVFDLEDYEGFWNFGESPTREEFANMWVKVYYPDK